MNTKTPSEHSRKALTLLETLAVIVVLAALAIFFAAVSSVRQIGSRLDCINNLKQIGTSYRIWANDHDDKYPMEKADASGGMQGILLNSSNAGRFAYLPYAIMQMELSQATKLVVCPIDERTANTSFNWGKRNAPEGVGPVWPGQPYDSFDNTNVSYFCGVGADETTPDSILGGDRNLGYGGVIKAIDGNVPSPEQDPNYGISGAATSPANPSGADAILNTNGQWVSSCLNNGSNYVAGGIQAVAWSARMHSGRGIGGAGNILLGDGSAQQCTSAGLRQTWLRYAINSGNFPKFDKLHSGAHGDIRLLFP